MNDIICHSTALVVPRFDELLRALAAPNVDIRLIEARALALTTTCWALVSPFYLINPKYKETFGALVAEMEACCIALQAAVQQAEMLVTAAKTPEEKPVAQEMKPIIRKPVDETKTEHIALKILKNDEPRTELLQEEAAPADPAIS